MSTAACKTNLRDLSLEQLTELVGSLGQPAFRARQLFAWLYRPGVADFNAMTDLSLDLRRQLAHTATMAPPAMEKVATSRDGTRKFLFRLDDGAAIESVLIPEPDRNTLCVSSQVGCAMGCSFCCTATLGFVRNLTTAEMVNQVVSVNNVLAAEEKPLLSNLVFMGMGEPLANLDNLLAALAILTDQRGLDFSPRRITVSTSGLVPGMAELGAASNVNLAISLHAADDITRSRLMPINRRYPLAQLLAAARDFPLPRRKRIMIEYILLAGINDSVNDARRLIRLLHGIKCKINLLPYNENEIRKFCRPHPDVIQAFQDTLWRAGHTVIVRESRGADIAAACGQLAGQKGGVL